MQAMSPRATPASRESSVGGIPRDRVSTEPLILRDESIAERPLTSRLGHATALLFQCSDIIRINHQHETGDAIKRISSKPTISHPGTAYIWRRTFKAIAHALQPSLKGARAVTSSPVQEMR